MFTRTVKKAWYEISHIEIKENSPVIVTETIETWFPERWEKKHSKTTFVKKQELTYKMSIPEEKLIEYAFENRMIKEETKND